MPERRSHDYIRHGTTDLFAAFNIADGTVISQLRRHHRAAEFKKFLARIDKNVPAGLEVHLVCDNLATHKTPLIRQWLARHPRFRLHFTPTGSSWMNQVERWFGFLTDQRIRRGVHKSVQALEADIRAWIENWNANPRPFAWTKTADEILDSLAKYIPNFRRGILGHVLETAHDMHREYRVMHALAPTAVPVPGTVCYIGDRSLLGAEFYVMDLVDGVVYRTAEEMAALSPAQARALSYAFIDSMADLHLVDYAAAGLADFGRPDGYLERQVRRWTRQLAASRSRDITGFEQLGARLAAGIPLLGPRLDRAW